MVTNDFKIPTEISTGKVLRESSAKEAISGGTQDEFNKILSREMHKHEELKFSAHVIKRMQMRNIEFTQNEFLKIRQAVEKAERKGIRESLVVINDVSLIVSITNKTVITAVDNKSLAENVITNIDGAVFI